MISQTKTYCVLIVLVFSLCCKKTDEKSYVYSYTIKCYGISQDTIKIVFDTESETAKTITKTVIKGFSFKPFEGSREYFSYCSADLFYKQITGIPKSVDDNFIKYIKNIKIIANDSVVYQQNPVKIELWIKHYNESNPLLDGGVGVSGAYYTLKLDSVYQPIMK